jgi:hypothetical protein
MPTRRTALLYRMLSLTFFRGSDTRNNRSRTATYQHDTSLPASDNRRDESEASATQKLPDITAPETQDSSNIIEKVQPRANADDPATQIHIGDDTKKGLAQIRSVRLHMVHKLVGPKGTLLANLKSRPQAQHSQRSHMAKSKKPPLLVSQAALRRGSGTKLSRGLKAH